MIFPLKELIEFDDNIYEITCASTRRAISWLKSKIPMSKKAETRLFQPEQSKFLPVK